MARLTLNPTLNQTFRISIDEDAKGKAMDFSAELKRSRKAESEGRWEEACDIRYGAMQALVELLPEDDLVELDWEDRLTRDAVMIAYCSAVDFFLVGDWEMAAAGLELVLDVDSDDHLEATTLLAFVYVAMGEWDSFGDILPDVADKSPEKSLLILWADWLRSGRLNKGEFAALSRFHAPYLREWCAEEHPTDGAYLADIDSDHPTKAAKARELWLQTEHLWREQGGFIEALKNAK
ncbi:MAG: tetratricopeptide repeat protein [Tidjanibacter sp.]|nr:tetratricopeptide repeat protein [Tidjanibacter sp.]